MTARGRVVVIGLGPAGADLVTVDAQRRLRQARHVFLRTNRHPAASLAPEATTFDDRYERAGSFDEVYRSIADALVEAAEAHGEVVYAVPGSPLVAEHTVELLIDDPRVDVELCPALSFADLAWVRLRIDPVREGARIVDGHRFAQEAAGERGPFLVAQCHSNDVLSDVKLSIDETRTGPVPEVTVLHHLGLVDEQIVRVSWADIDRSVDADHLTSLYIPKLSAPVAAAFVGIEELMRELRARCPWDAQQTHASLSRYVLEEAYELVEAIGGLGLDGGIHGDPIEHLCDELGDVLFQVVFHTCLAAEEGWFDLADVITNLRAKLVRRHPHVFAREDFDTMSGEHAVADVGDVVRNWETIKRAERATIEDEPFATIPSSLPALLYAAKVVQRTERIDPALVDRDAGAASLDEAELGDLILRIVASARQQGIDPEVALRRAAMRLRELVSRASS